MVSRWVATMPEPICIECGGFCAKPPMCQLCFHIWSREF